MIGSVNKYAINNMVADFRQLKRKCGFHVMVRVFVFSFQLPGVFH